MALASVLATGPDPVELSPAVSVIPEVACVRCGTTFLLSSDRRKQRRKYCTAACRTTDYKSNRVIDKDAMQRSAIRKMYGITLEAARALYDAQGGKCALCLQLIPWDGRERAIDHDHETGRVRGILCRGCNFILAHIERLPVSRRAWMARVLAYLKESR